MKATNGFTHKDYTEINRRFNEICDSNFDSANEELVKLAACIFSMEAMCIQHPETIEEKARYVLAKRILSNYEIKDKKAFVVFPSPFFEKEDFPNEKRDKDDRIAMECWVMIHDDGMKVMEAFEKAAEKHITSVSVCRAAYYNSYGNQGKE
ncbi:hypothetical protein [Malikia sp.]|uniref:hypothetical protein n=1 Tax=Malikia sp. TaxID=2070706 RepID=UPI002639A0A3|nr:hypothetical protein [Malikia sp.]MDD2729725.1 hypothetical protein [Malikia sp.]